MRSEVTKPKSIFKTFLKGLALLFAALATWIAVEVLLDASGYVFPWNEKEVIETAQRWGRLAELPEDAEITAIKQQNGLLNQIYQIEFKAPLASIDSWIKSSEGIRNSKPFSSTPDIDEYSVKYEGQTAEGGTIEVNRAKATVTIHVNRS